ncbi:MAG TPA: hypothetical protein VLS93_02640 [Anaeromyxobacteraceae bacterium]|nr:hypothetical protein [Anaeromyxobacteraceae bacterium]
MRWLVRGDVDGFFGLALDNLVQLLLVDALCRGVLGFSAELVHGRILPAAAVSILVGNLYYAWQARRLALRTGRTDVCALPYGVNTVSLFGHVFLVMLPARLAAEAAGHPDPARAAWEAGLLATVGSGVIESAGAFVAERIRRATPRAALLSTLAGIALGFISLGFLFRTFARPVVGLATLGIVLLTYFGHVRFRGRIPGGLVAVALGTLLAWLTGIAPASASAPPWGGLALPVPALDAVLRSLRLEQLAAYFSVILPMGLFNVVGSLQNVESAEAAGDPYPTRPSLLVNGLGTLAAAAFGSPFPTTIYIGHPGWKALGARAGYSILNGAFFTVVALTGTLGAIAWAIPVDAGMAIVLWIGMVIAAQAFQATPRGHAPAVVVGLLPALGAWGALMAKAGLRAAGLGSPGAPFSDAFVGAFQAGDVWITGAFALEQGFIFTSMILAAATVAVIERRFLLASAWTAAAAILSALGLVHSWRYVQADTAILLAPAWPWAAGYAAMAAVFAAARWVTEPGETHG